MKLVPVAVSVKAEPPMPAYAGEKPARVGTSTVTVRLTEAVTEVKSVLSAGVNAAVSE